MLMSSAISERAGDSGGTIYLTNTSQNRLIGIVKGQSGNTMINGIPWTSIASAYYSCTGLILSPKINVPIRPRVPTPKLCINLHQRV